MKKEKNPYQLKTLKDGSLKFIIRAKDMDELKLNIVASNGLILVHTLVCDILRKEGLKK